MTQLEDTYALSTNSLTFHMFSILASWKGAFCHAEPSGRTPRPNLELWKVNSFLTSLSLQEAERPTRQTGKVTTGNAAATSFCVEQHWSCSFYFLNVTGPAVDLLTVNQPRYTARAGIDNLILVRKLFQFKLILLKIKFSLVSLSSLHSVQQKGVSVVHQLHLHSTVMVQKMEQEYCT